MREAMSCNLSPSRLATSRLCGPQCRVRLSVVFEPACATRSGDGAGRRSASRRRGRTGPRRCSTRRLGRWDLQVSPLDHRPRRAQVASSAMRSRPEAGKAKRPPSGGCGRRLTGPVCADERGRNRTATCNVFRFRGGDDPGVGAVDQALHAPLRSGCLNGGPESADDADYVASCAAEVEGALQAAVTRLSAKT